MTAGIKIKVLLIFLSPKLQKYSHSSPFPHCSLTLEVNSFCQMPCVNSVLGTHYLSGSQRLRFIRNLLLSEPPPPFYEIFFSLTCKHAFSPPSDNMKDIILTFSSYVLIFLFSITDTFPESTVSRVFLMFLNPSYKLWYFNQASSSTTHQNMFLSFSILQNLKIAFHCSIFF